jgi:hypothetical protein
VHVVALIETIEAAEADLVILIETPFQAVRPWLPAELPVALWSEQSLRVDEGAPGKEMPSERSVKDGSDGGSAYELCPLAADDRLLDAFKESLAPSSSRAVVLMDLPDARPEALSLTLPSHLALWDSLLEIAKLPNEPMSEGCVERWFQRAERQSGTILTDPGVRSRFLELARETVLPLAWGWQVVHGLRQAGWSAEFFGANWSSLVPPESVGGPIPWSGDWHELLKRGEWLIFPDASPRYARMVLDALLAGLRAVVGTTRDEWDRRYTALREVALHLDFFASASGLSTLLRRAQAEDPQDRLRRRREARAVIERAHRVTHRLQSLASCGVH